MINCFQRLLSISSCAATPRGGRRGTSVGQAGPHGRAVQVDSRLTLGCLRVVSALKAEPRVACAYFQRLKLNPGSIWSQHAPLKGGAGRLRIDPGLTLGCLR